MKYILLITLCLFTSMASAERVLTETGLKTVITVATYGGDFVSPEAAVNSILYTGPKDQYLILIEEGEYYVGNTLELRPYVDIAGVGPDKTTVTMGVRGGERPIISVGGGFNESPNKISNISLANYSRGERSVGIKLESKAVLTLEHVNVNVTGSPKNIGIHNAGARIVVMDSNIQAQRFGENSESVAFLQEESVGASAFFEKTLLLGSTYGYKSEESLPAGENVEFLHSEIAGGAASFHGYFLAIEIMYSQVNNGIEIDPISQNITFEIRPTCRGSYTPGNVALDRDCEPI